MGKKYILTDETLNYKESVLHRIKAVRNFGDVKAGDLGGWIETESNLSHEGNCWVYNHAKVFERAKVIGDAKISAYAEIYGNARISGSARVTDYANIFASAIVKDEAKIFEYAKVYDFAHVIASALIYGNARVLQYARIAGCAKVYGNARIYGSAWVYAHAQVYGDSIVEGNTKIDQQAIVADDIVTGNAWISGDAIVVKCSDFIVFKNWWSSGRYFTWTKSNNMWRAGCFYGTGEQLVAKAYKDSEESGREYERIVRYVESILEDERKL